MNTALVMLGSNSHPEQNIELAIEKLSQFFEIEKQGSLIETKPHGKHYIGNFQNLALRILSEETAEETKLIFKDIEKEMGRSPESKTKGAIPIDIDLIIWNEHLLHKDYERFDFVKKCIDELKD
jgi:2-amino-4-hydroxy-6-hydroxymethyldihydropteridine diphosphokinase